jgi:RHS repeat-associated protein
VTAICETRRLRLREFRPGDLDELAAMVGDEEQMRFYPGPRTRDEAAAWIVRNRSGSIAAVTDSTGAVVSTYEYDPYGNSTGTTGTLYEPFRYAGGYWDATTIGHAALYKFGERYYDPSIGRWTQPDPVNNPLDLKGWNGYDYAGDNPINMIDPSGLSIWHSIVNDG